MALSSTTSRVSYSGNGSTTAFSFPYYFLANADLVVILKAANGTETTQTITTHYTVTGAGVTSGGTVTMVTAPASGATLTIYRDPAATQDLDLVENDPLPAEELEERLDKVTMLAQRSKDRLDRAVRLTDGYSASFDPKLPAVLTADTVIKINAAGDGFEIGPTVDEIETAEASATAAAASASAASSSASAASASATAASGSATAASGSAAAAAASAALISLPLAATSGGTAQSTYTTGDMLYASATNTLSKLGIGSANQVIKSVGGIPTWTAAPSSGINYLSSNPDAEVDTAGWATYADAAGTIPVDGTGGSANVTWTRSTTTPLRGSSDFNFTKDAVNRQGQGVSYDFTIDSADKAKVLTVSFDYEVVSGTYASSDMIVYIYDVTNAALIQPAGYTIQGVVGSLRQLATFQTASNSTSYRLILHVSSTSALAYTLAFDNFSVGPASIVNGTPVTDWTSFTPTGAWSTNTTYTGYWRRVGGDLEAQVLVSTAGAPTSATLSVNLPSGLSIDTTRIVQTPDNRATFGYGLVRDSASTSYDLSVGYLGTATSVTAFVKGTASTYADLPAVTQAVPITFGANDQVQLFFKVPIVGWSSNVQMSSDTDTRVVSLVANSTNAQSIPNSTSTTVTTWTVQQDTHGAFNATTGVYTVQVPGVYQISGLIAFAANGTGNRELIAVHTGSNKTLDREAANGTDGNYSTGTATFNCIAGDTLRLNVSQNSGGSLALQGAAQYQYIQICRLSGPSLVAATESVNARYTTAAGQAVTNGSTTIIDFGTKVWDSHNAVTTGASWKYTAPVAGKYRFTFSALAQAAHGTFQFNLVKNGSTYSELYRNLTSNQNLWTGTDTVDLVAGDYCDVRLNNGSGGTITLNANAQECRVTIERIGN